MAERGPSSSLHIAMLPWLAFGHLNPFMELSRRIAALGHRVSFLSAPSNLRRLASGVPDHLSHLLHLVELPFTAAAHIDGAESTADLDDDLQIPYLLKSFDNLEKQLEIFLLNASPEVDWIIYDSSAWWTPRAAAAVSNCGTRCLYLSMLSAAYHTFLGPTEALKTSGKLTLEDLTRRPSWIKFNTCVSFHKFQVEQFVNSQLKKDVTGLSGADRIRLSVEGADVIAVRGCAELESEWLEALRDLYNKPVIAAGHFPINGGDGSEAEAEVSQWLDNNENDSVVYVAFGSEALPEKEQICEIARGLEMSELPFLWAFRKPEMLPEGFVERNRKRGIVCSGWVPQVKILAHPSVGGFMTHCGWNSLVEALQFGVALILFPLVNDEGINARFMAEKMAGMEIPRNNDDGSFEATAIARTLRKVVVEDEGQECRRRAKELGEVLGNKDVQNGYVEDFVHHLVTYKPTSRVANSFCA